VQFGSAAGAKIVKLVFEPTFASFGEPDCLYHLHGILSGPSRPRLEPTSPAVDQPGACDWWPDGKVTRQHLPRLLAHMGKSQGLAPGSSVESISIRGIRQTVRRDLR
jgi:hypothetical protein